MIRVAKTYKDMERLEFITFIATDSASSSVTSLEKLLEHYGANPEKWKPVRLPVAEAAEVARRMFFLHPGTAADDPGQPLNDTVVLIDSHQRIRGYYDGRSEEHTSELQSLMRISY